MTDHENYFEDDHGEGYLEIDDYELFYRRFGDGESVLLVLHGGPGSPHDYLAPLARHGSDERTVFMYDQFATGRSDRPAAGDFDRYTVEHYREEVEAVRRSLDAESVVVYGQSWGAMLALEYAIEYGDRIDGLIVANGMADTASGLESARAVLEEFDDDLRETIREHEARRAFDDPAYEAALETVYKTHVCRIDPYPGPVKRSFENGNMDVYGLLWGPSEYVVLETARLRGWDVRDSLPEIDVPTLVLTGSYDEFSPEIAADIADRIPDAELVEFAESSHMPFWEQPEEHYETVERFLDRVLE